MRAQDFAFLRQKGILKGLMILCCILIALTFTQISLEQQSGIDRVNPILVLDSSLFESLGLFFPIFAILFFFFHNRSVKGHSFLLLIQILGVIVIVTLIMAFLGVPETPEEELPEITSNTTSMSQTYQSTTQSTIIPSQSGITESTLGGSIPLSQIFTEFRALFFIAILLLPIFFIIVIQHQAKLPKTDLNETDPRLDGKNHISHEMRTVLECYYQASTSLEQRGANSSPSFTPTEFNKDVIEKNLTSSSLINGLTDVFEEAKFSNHDISPQHVKKAKTFASKIIFHSNSSLKTDSEKEHEEKI
ncbi:MAG: DUF4129 domain-containing protein [Candidatus Heimdallarchaeota archaeon]|nr:MAG: DUF4129 domain-containing protein [Candidatus Heimdallarchaeota archaeon]